MRQANNHSESLGLHGKSRDPSANLLSFLVEASSQPENVLFIRQMCEPQGGRCGADGQGMAWTLQQQAAMPEADTNERALLPLCQQASEPPPAPAKT